MTDDCREAFENKFKTLDLTKTRDAWDRTIYAHSHIQAMFEGYEAAWNARTPPAGDAQGALSVLEDIFFENHGNKVYWPPEAIKQYETIIAALKDKGVSAPKIDFEGLKREILEAHNLGDDILSTGDTLKKHAIIFAIDHIAAKYPQLKGRINNEI